MRFSPHILDEIRARLSVSHVVGRKVALKKKGREFVGLSPFKSEKTPSFSVNDQKGFYHCFASGEHGDVFTFLMKTEGISFPEAVERLAAEAGVVLPKPEPRDGSREDERQRLFVLLEASAEFFEQSLASADGAEARRYLDARGLKRVTIDAFRIGYAPNSRSGLKEYLANAGFTSAEMTTAGMLIAGDEIPVAYDRFRHRVMFPIADSKGRIIAFGGRALDTDQPAKYLNSPETPLFHKGHVLFNAHRARGPAHDKNRIIVVEGYMDVVALCETGFAETVAPLGTAVTENQIKLLWRMAPEPILCFDGDSAGRKAAFRAIDTALPLLKPGASLMFAFLPDGLDPDDLIRQQGPAALDNVLRRARPLIDVLFEREFHGRDWSTPERRARLEQQLRTLAARIEDQTVRAHYQRDLSKRLETEWGRDAGPPSPTNPNSAARGTRPYAARPLARPLHVSGREGRPPRIAAGGSMYNPARRPNPSASLKNSTIVVGEGVALPRRETLLVRAIVNHPWLIDEHAETIASLPLTSPALSRLRDAILSAHALDNSLDTATLRSHLSKTGVGKVLTLVERAISRSHKCDRFAEPDADRTEVEDGWRHALALHERYVGLKRSLEAAEKAWHEDRSETAYARICELQRQVEHLIRVESAEWASEANSGP